MIESKTLGSAVGIQRQGVIDRSDISSLPAVGNGVIAGKFKRGRMDKPFKVTAANYRALLGHDPANASYLAVEDLFKRGASSVMVLRTGNSFAVSMVAANVRLWASGLYPILVEEKMRIGASMRGHGYTMNAIVDNLEVGASLTGSGILKSHAPPPPPESTKLSLPIERVDLFAAMTGVGELWEKPKPPVIVIPNHKLAIENMTLSGRMTGTGELKDYDILYDRAIDKIAVSATMKGTGELK